MKYFLKEQLDKKGLKVVFSFPMTDPHWAFDNEAWVCQDDEGKPSLWSTHGGVLIEISKERLLAKLDFYKSLYNQTLTAIHMTGSLVKEEA